MMPDPKAAEDFATLVLVTARTLRRLIKEPLNPRRRAAMLTELNDALAPFDAEQLEAHDAGGCAPPVYTAPLQPIHDPECARIVLIDAECDCAKNTGAHAVTNDVVITPPQEAKRFPALSSPATLRELIADGVYLDLPMDHYIDDPAISGSGLKKLLVSPTDFKWELPKRNPLFTPSESDARLLGTLVHCAVLEGMAAFDDRYFVAPEFDDTDPRVIRTADHAKNWLAERGEKKTGLKAELFERVKACADLMKLEGAAEDELPVFLDDAIAALAAMGNGRRIKIKQRDHDYVAQVCAVVRAWPDVAALFAAGAGLPEVSVFWTVDGVRYKARLDWLSAAAVVDIKKFGKMPPRGTSLEGFLQQEAMFYCYDTQAVHNRRAAMQIPLLLKAGLCSASGEGARARLDLLTAISDAIVREPPIFHWLWLRTPGPPQGLLMDFHHETKRWEHCEFEIDQVALENLQRYRKTCGHELEADKPWVQVGRASWDDDEVRDRQWNLSR